MTSRTWAACALMITCGQALAGPYSPPAGEYTLVDAAVAGATPATLTTDLRNALRTRTSSPFSRVTYQNGRFRYDESDLDLTTPGNLIVIYSGASISSVWDAGSTWNREHTWPVSHMRNQSSGSNEYCDFHQLRPCFSSVNSSRGNKPFGENGTNNGSALWDAGFDPRGGSQYTFDPQDRGEVARAMFYFAVRHNNTLKNVSSEGQLADGEMGDLATLLRWHYAHTADEQEYYRNDTIDDSIQFNRNPFVDRNEYVWAIWGTSPNDSAITLDGATPTGGATQLTIDLGDIIVGESFGDAQAGVTKTGTTPTTYSVSTTGDAINDLSDVTQTPVALGGGAFSVTTNVDDWFGRNQAFAYGPATQSATLTGITLLEQSTPGVRVGTVVIDNTDLTSAGPGLGNADGDDVITVVGREVEHSNASFSPSADSDTLILDFGTVELGSELPLDVVIHNLQAPSGFTADLRSTGLTSSGDASAFDAGATSFSDVEGGSSVVIPVSIVAGAPGSYEATYSIGVADADIPGAAPNTSLALVVRAVVTEPTIGCFADLDGSGAVDFQDFLILSGEFGREDCPPCAADIDGSGDVGFQDFLTLSSEFGRENCD